MINQLDNLFRVISLQHKQIESYICCENPFVAVDGNTKYPLLVLEQPFNITYDKFKTYTISFDVLDYINDKTEEQTIIGLTKCEEIVDDIITFFKDQNFREYLLRYEFQYNNAVFNAVTLRNITNDNVIGIRVDMTLIAQIQSDRCLTSFTFTDPIPEP